MKTIAVAFLLTLLALPSPSTETHEVGFVVQVAGGPWDTYVPPAHAGLTSVEVEVEMQLGITYQQEVTAGNARVIGFYGWDPRTPDLRTRWQVALTVPGDVPHFLSMSENAQTIITPGPPDGVLDYGGASGETRTFNSDEKSVSTTYTDAAHLAYFQAGGLVKLETLVLHDWQGWAWFDFFAHYAARVTAQNPVTVRVTYSY